MYRGLLFLYFLSFAASSSVWDGLMNVLDVSNIGEEDWKLNINELAEKHGYPLETHTVVTDDGYIITVHRMITTNASRNDKVVLLISGLWDSSISWLLQGRNGLAFQLADQGFDVWMGNIRGNQYCLQHKTLSPDMQAFWNFGWEEIGLYDLPATVDHILNTTGVNRIFYLGFSLGTTSYFVMNSMKPEYNDKIKLMIAVAPIVFLTNVKISKTGNVPALYLIHEILSYNEKYSTGSVLSNEWFPFTCKIFPSLCVNIFNILNGPHNINRLMLPVILKNMPSGGSMLEWIHYGQLVDSKRFGRFDYGKTENMKKYGQPTPPDYNLKAVTSPVVLVYSEEDWFSDSRDVEMLKKKMPNVVGSYSVQNYSHLDFLYGDTSSTLLYPYFIDQFEKYQENNKTENYVQDNDLN